MPNKGYKRTEEHQKNLNLSLKGRKAWNKDRKGEPWTIARRIAENNKIKKANSCMVGDKEYPLLWKELRKIVYKRDNYRCQECGVHCHNGKRINAHHIDYDITKNDLFNLITLCASCHAKTNFRRVHWIIHYTRSV